MNPECRIKRISNNIPASILDKSDVADGPITARYRLIKNAYFLIYTLNASEAILMKVLLYPYRREKRPLAHFKDEFLQLEVSVIATET